jgi:ankyrin repeat protein
MKRMLFLSLFLALSYSSWSADKSNDSESHNGEIGECFLRAWTGDLTKVKKCLEANPRLVKQKNIDGNTLLHQAALGSQKEVAALLISKGAEVNAENNKGETPLHIGAGGCPPDSDCDAFRQSQFEFAKFLLVHNANVNARDKEGMTPLHVAAVYANKKVTELLIEKGADVDAKTRSGESAYQLATLDIKELLRRHGITK